MSTSSCPRCGAISRFNAAFCSQCGASLPTDIPGDKPVPAALFPKKASTCCPVTGRATRRTLLLVVLVIAGLSFAVVRSQVRRSLGLYPQCETKRSFVPEPSSGDRLLNSTPTNYPNSSSINQTHMPSGRRLNSSAPSDQPCDNSEYAGYTEEKTTITTWEQQLPNSQYSPDHSSKPPLRRPRP